MNKTDFFITSVKSIENEEFTVALRTRAKCALLDYIGVTLAGLKEQIEQIKSLEESFFDGEGTVYPIGMNSPKSLNNAVFLNGLNGHALDFDDGTNAGIIHLGSPIFSVLLALAQKYDFDGETLLKSAILGYETSFTMAKTIQPVHKQRGYHATGTCGMLGIAMAVSKALGFNEEETKRAFSTAALSATGSLKVLEDSSQLKPYNVAKASLLGLVATQMAKAGFLVADDCLSGVTGFLNQMYGSEDVDFISPKLNGTLAIEKAYIKPYAACRYTHPSIDIAKDLREENINPDDIERVSIKTYSLAVKKHDHTEILGSASAKMSIPYNFAVTFITGKTGMDAFTNDCLENEDVKNLTRKISVEADDSMTALFPEKTIATVEIITKSGKAYRGESILPKGEPENPLTLEETIEKFTSLCVYGGKTEEHAQKIVNAVFEIETKLPELLELLR